MCCLREVDDPRKPSNGTLHDFVEILVIAMAAVLSDCDTVEDIAYWAHKKEDWLRQFLPIKNGVPSEKTFLRIFRALDPKQFEVAFRRWVAEVVGALHGGIAVDGKTVRGSGSGGETAIHMVSAFATELGVVLGQEKVAAKSNEITAIPELLQALQIKGLLVTIDAMGCQRNIARQITDQGAAPARGQGNQPALLEAIQTDFIDQSQSPVVDRHRQAHKSRGRIVGQIASVLPAEGTVDVADWPKCKTIGLVDSLRKVGDDESNFERRYYISSRELTAEQLAVAVRGHWAVESVPQAHRKEVRNGLTNCVEATRKMRVGPSGSAFRSGPQTTPSCCGQEPWW
ncbi:MAG: ISAs1 family transposase [Candidatus Accumulibacter sp.]|uniref:ISAs1 family transposase n=1 Tax=Candidatus Accumulibacter proximus TaxID=2954385 RepID=A0A935Q244_9PROT|nr:ISAs1 family transposase [Candidatus Accumulibacter proximus]